MRNEAENDWLSMKSLLRAIHYESMNFQSLPPPQIKSPYLYMVLILANANFDL